MNEGNNTKRERLLDLGVVVAVVIAVLFGINRIGEQSDAISADVESTQRTVSQLQRQRNSLAQREDMAPLPRVWRASKNVTDSCGVQRSVFDASSDGNTLYTGSGDRWSAEINGNAISVRTCADQLSTLNQIVFEKASLQTAKDTPNARVTFSMYGRLAAQQAAN